MLRGEVVDPPIKAHIEHDVELTDTAGNITIVRATATIDKIHAAKTGDTLSSGGTNWKLDVLVVDNGYSTRHILVEV